MSAAQQVELNWYVLILGDEPHGYRIVFVEDLTAEDAGCVNAAFYDEHSAKDYVEMLGSRYDS